MTKDHFKREYLFQVTFSIARTMHDRGLVTSEELGKIEALLINKYRPLLGSLSVNSLDFPSFLSDV